MLNTMLPIVGDRRVVEDIINILTFYIPSLDDRKSRELNTYAVYDWHMRALSQWQSMLVDEKELPTKDEHMVIGLFSPEVLFLTLRVWTLFQASIDIVKDNEIAFDDVDKFISAILCREDIEDDSLDAIESLLHMIDNLLGQALPRTALATCASVIDYSNLRDSSTIVMH